MEQRTEGSALPKWPLLFLLAGFSCRGTETMGIVVPGTEAGAVSGSKGTRGQAEGDLPASLLPQPHGDKRLPVNRRVNEFQSHPLSTVGFCHLLLESLYIRVLQNL